MLETRMSVRRFGFRVAAFVVLSAAVAGASGCATQGPYTWVKDLPVTQASTTPVVQPRDVLSVVVAGQPTLGGEFVVQEDGAIVVPLVGKVSVSGLTANLAATQLSMAWKKMVVDPNVSVVIGKAASPRVNVVGEVKAPGVYELVRDHSVLGALAAAGWITDFARADGVFVIRLGKTAGRIRFTLADIKAAETKTAAFRLMDGDSVVVE